LETFAEEDRSVDAHDFGPSVAMTPKFKKLLKLLRTSAVINNIVPFIVNHLASKHVETT
jgi:hypothetical protein